VTGQEHGHDDADQNVDSDRISAFLVGKQQIGQQILPPRRRCSFGDDLCDLQLELDHRVRSRAMRSFFMHGVARDECPIEQAPGGSMYQWNQVSTRPPAYGIPWAAGPRPGSAPSFSPVISWLSRSRLVRRYRSLNAVNPVDGTDVAAVQPPASCSAR